MSIWQSLNLSEVRTEFGDDENFEAQFDEGDVTEPDEIAAAVAFAPGRNARR